MIVIHFEFEFLGWTRNEYKRDKGKQDKTNQTSQISEATEAA